MSKCISGQGEYSDHTPGDEEFVCGRCYVVDEEAMRAEIERLRAALTADRLSVTETTTVCVHCGLPLDPEGIADDGSSNCAASQEGPADDLGNVPHEPAETTTGPAITVAQDAAIRAEAWAEGYNKASEINEGFHDVERHNPYHANTRAETTTAHECDSGDFDRTICGCGAMHSYCTGCGTRQDDCKTE